mgnify:CR=1 FL=1
MNQSLVVGEAPDLGLPLIDNGKATAQRVIPFRKLPL